VVKPKTGEQVRAIGDANLSIECLGISPDGRRALTGSGDGTVRLWNLETGQELHQLRDHTERVHFVAFSPDGKFGASGGGEAGGRDFTIRLWDLDKGTLIRQVGGHDKDIWTLAFSPNGQQLASTSFDGSLRVWEVGRPGTMLVMRVGAVASSAVFAPDGKQILTALASGRVTLFRVEIAAQPTEIRTFQGPTQPATYAVFTPDGTRVLAVGHDNTLRVWQTDTAKPLAQLDLAKLKGNDKTSRRIAVSRDGKRALVLDDGGTIVECELPE
jgi:WD40 repeat protein